MNIYIYIYVYIYIFIRADSLEVSRFLPSFMGKMAVFDKTESLE